MEEPVKRAVDFTDSSVPAEMRNPEYLKFQEGKFKVSGDGCFYTLQGEGITMGMPAVFLRLHVCNLQCVWCDSWYTWNKKTPQFWQEAFNWSIEETEKRLMEEWKCTDKRVPMRVIVTGGEPMLQKDLISELALRHLDWRWEIETNGTLMPTQVMFEHFQFNCSPKLENSKNPAVLRIKPDVLRFIDRATSQFKFVVMAKEDLDEIERDFISTGFIRKDKVILMPEGVTSQAIWEHAREVAEYAKVKGYRMMGRMQTDVWGTRRRV